MDVNKALDTIKAESKRFDTRHDVLKRQEDLDEAALSIMSDACNRNLVKIPVDMLGIIASTYAASIVTRDMLIQLMVEGA